MAWSPCWLLARPADEHAVSGDTPVSRPQPSECPGCGLFQTVPGLARGMTAYCGRCSTTLHSNTSHPLGHSLALTLAATVLLIVMCTTTLMSVQTAGIAHSAYLLSGPASVNYPLKHGGTCGGRRIRDATGAVRQTHGTLYVLIRLRQASPPDHLRHVFVLAERLRPWSMIEVFVFGVFVAYVKLGDLVHITLEKGVYALLALTVVLIWADSTLDREAIWNRLDRRGADGDGDPPIVERGRGDQPARSVAWSVCRCADVRAVPAAVHLCIGASPTPWPAPGRW